MSKWKEIQTYMEVNPYTGQEIDEDMPTNAAGRGAVAGIGVGPDGESGINPKKKTTSNRMCLYPGKNMFSMATTAILAAIIGSTICEGAATRSNVARPSVIV